MFGRIRITLALAAISVVATGCTSNSYQAYIKPGTSLDRTNRDRAACTTEANKLFPAANFPRTYPSGHVGYYGGGWGWGVGVVHTTDVNAGMRNQHRNECMVLKGYQPVTFPMCSRDQIAGQSFAPLTRAPEPSATICAIELEGGGRALIDLSKPL